MGAKKKRIKYTTEQLKTSYPVKCYCGWGGLSEDCSGGEQIADTGDYGDPLCPVCVKLAVDTCASCTKCESEPADEQCPIAGISASVEDDEDYEEV